MNVYWITEFNVGDVVRNRRPYWGEAAYKICEPRLTGPIAVSTSGKFGHGGLRTGDPFKMKYYKVAPRLMRAWLFILGWLSVLYFRARTWQAAK